MAYPYIYMAVAARIHGHYYPYIYMTVAAPINARITAPIYALLLRLTTVRPRRLNISRLYYSGARRH